MRAIIYQNPHILTEAAFPLKIPRMTYKRTNSLQGHLLLAMPDMGDPRFQRSVIYLFSHGADGAMGFVINQPAKGATMADILEAAGTQTYDAAFAARPVFIGGPVQKDNGFVLHTADYTTDDTQTTDGQPLALTLSIDILTDAARGEGPKDLRFLLGYAGWSAGQLETELQDNAWLIGPATPDIVFMPDKDGTAIYAHCAAAMGIDLAQLSHSGGEA